MKSETTMKQLLVIYSDSSYVRQGDDWDSRATINFPTLFHVSRFHDGLALTKQDTCSPDIAAWGLVVWGLTKFHTGPQVDNSKGVYYIDCR